MERKYNDNRETFRKNNENYENSRKNHEGYDDPTAYEAIKHLEAEYERHRKLLGCIFRICELSGFRVEGHIQLRDMRTGKLWK